MMGLSILSTMLIEVIQRQLRVVAIQLRPARPTGVGLVLYEMDNNTTKPYENNFKLSNWLVFNYPCNADM